MAGIPTPTQAEINTAKTALAQGAAPPVYAADGSGARTAQPPWPHPNGHPPGQICK